MNTIKITKNENIAILQLDRGKSNALNLEMFQDIIDAFESFKKDDDVKAVVLTGKGNFFSAGLDVIELYNYNESKIEALFEILYQTMKTMVSFSKPLVASINGHSPAGGCILAICADYRIMAEGNFRIGLNEIPVGIIMPHFIFEMYAYWLGRGKAAQFILEGKLCSDEEALDVGLVNEVVEQESLLYSSIEKAKSYAKFSANTWSTSKMVMREELLKHFEVFNPKFKQELLNQWWSKETRSILGALVEKLTKK